MAIKDLTGKKFGRLTVIKLMGVGKDRYSLWFCECDCGNTKLAHAGRLRNGTLRSCGCLHSEQAKENYKHCIKHGLSQTRIYSIWKGMLERCENSKSKVYKHYGERGITICEEWKDIKTFYDWALNNGYKDNLEIDRIDNNGNYEPSNCKWSTRKEQTNNERRNIRVEINGEEHTLAQWAEKIGIVENTLQYRYHRGDRGERLIRPVETKYRRKYNV